MPIYEYRCRTCSHDFEALGYGDERPACLSCRGTELEKHGSAFAVGHAAATPPAACAAGGPCGEGAPRAGGGPCCFDD